jgi:hypothetical protein
MLHVDTPRSKIKALEFRKSSSQQREKLSGYLCAINQTGLSCSHFFHYLLDAKSPGVIPCRRKKKLPVCAKCRLFVRIFVCSCSPIRPWDHYERVRDFSGVVTGATGAPLALAMGSSSPDGSGEVTTGLPLATVGSPELVGDPDRGVVTSFPSVTLSPPMGSFGLSSLMTVGSSSANPTFEPLRIEIFFSA